MAHRPLCFVLMPFGKKAVGGTAIDFDAIYSMVIAPAVEQAELQPLRADEETAGGIIHKPMFERLVLCEYAIADLTMANANVFYELGVRHATRPRSTLLLFAEGQGQLPFDVAPLRALPYRLGEGGRPAAPRKAIEAIRARLEAAKAPDTDSPLYQLLEDYPDIDHTKTDVFRDRVEIGERHRRALAAARNTGIGAVRAVEQEMGHLDAVEGAAVIDLLLSYRAVSAWDDMIRLVERMPQPLRNTVMVQEQLGLSLNRVGRGEEAEGVIRDLLKERGKSSETLGILGRIYKDRWQAAMDSHQTALARGVLDQAIGAYLEGFETDWRDAYPGVNAVTLMEFKDPPDHRQAELIPIVAYAVKRRLAKGEADYWDHATLLELAVLGNDEAAAGRALSSALASSRESWERESTARNLKLIYETRKARNGAQPWLLNMIRSLQPV